MSGTYKVEWLPGNVLCQRRTGVLTVEQARAYVAEVGRAMQRPPAIWGLIVDTREAEPQPAEVQALIQGLIRETIEHNVKLVAIVTTSALTGIQQRRMTAGPGMHDLSTIQFFTDYEVALSGLRAELKAHAALTTVAP